MVNFWSEFIVAFMKSAATNPKLNIVNPAMAAIIVINLGIRFCMLAINNIKIRQAIPPLERVKKIPIPAIKNPIALWYFFPRCIRHKRLIRSIWAAMFAFINNPAGLPGMDSPGM